MQRLLEEIKRTIVFIGKTAQNAEGKDEDVFFATGFLVQIQDIFHLVTAKHVVYDRKKKELKDNDYWAAFNSRSGQAAKRNISAIKKQHGVNWIFHPDENVDIAIIPFGLDPQNDDIKVIPQDLFLSGEDVKELYDVFFLSFQPRIPYENAVRPIIRAGIISRINKDSSFYIDGSAFPGNSGSPVFLKPSPIRFNDKGIQLGGDSLGGKFIGIIGEYLPYQEVAISVQTERPRIVFEENTGLSKVWSCKFLQEVIDLDAFKQQLNSLTKSNENGKTAE